MQLTSFLNILFPQTYVELAFEVGVGFAVSVIVMSFAEYVLHGYFMHKRILPEFAYRLFPQLDQEIREHRELHHDKYYHRFDHEDDPYGKNLNLKISYWTNFYGLLFLSPILAVVVWWTSLVPVAMLALVIILHRNIWNLIHIEMHIPQHRAWTRSRVYKFLARYHYMHHVSSRAHATKNFNVVLPFADYILGNVARPTPEDRDAMKSLGFQD